LAAIPKGFCCLACSDIGVDLSVDLFREGGKVVESRMHLLSRESEDLARTPDPIINWYVSANDTANYFPDIGSTDKASSPSSGAIAEHHERVMSQSEPFLDEFLCQCRGGELTCCGLRFEPLEDFGFSEANGERMRHDYIVVVACALWEVETEDLVPRPVAKSSRVSYVGKSALRHARREP